MKEIKADIRRRIKEKRLLLEQAVAERLSVKVCKRVLGLKEFEEHSSFLFYYPFKREVSLISLFETFKSLGKEILFPKVSGKDILPLKVDSLEDFKAGFKGIMEPVSSKRIAEPEVVFVPGIAFDFDGHRIGYGGGFYDRFLSGRECLKVGICFDFQMVKKIPAEPFDVHVDIVVSEKRTVRRRKWKY